MLEYVPAANVVFAAFDDAPLHEIHWSTEDVLKLLLDAHEVEQGSAGAWFEAHQDIDITSGCEIRANDRSKKGELGNPPTAADFSQPFPIEFDLRRHASILPRSGQARASIAGRWHISALRGHSGKGTRADGVTGVLKDDAGTGGHGARGRGDGERERTGGWGDWGTGGGDRDDAGGWGDAGTRGRGEERRQEDWELVKETGDAWRRLLD